MILFSFGNHTYFDHGSFLRRWISRCSSQSLRTWQASGTILNITIKVSGTVVTGLNMMCKYVYIVYTYLYIYREREVSWNRGTPKSLILAGFPMKNRPATGVPMFMKTPISIKPIQIYIYITLYKNIIYHIIYHIIYQ